MFFHGILFLFLISLAACGTTYRQYDVSDRREIEIAEDYVRAGDYEKAFSVYKNTYRLHKADNSLPDMLFCLERMGWLKREIGYYGEALELFRKAYPIGVRLNGDAAEIDADIGDVYLFSGDSERAETHYRKTLTTLKDFVFKTSYRGPPSKQEITGMVRKTKAIVHARVNLGTLYYFDKKYETALEHLLEADRLIQRVLKVSEHALYGMFFKLDADFFEGVGFCQTILAATYGEMGQFDIS